MLDMLRKKSGSFAVYFVFAILIVVFAVGFGAVAPDQACGGGPPGSFKNRDLAEVDGEVIDAVMLRTAMQLTGDEADPKRGFVDQDDRFRYQTRFAYMNLYGPFSGGAYGTEPSQQSPIKLLKVMDELIEAKVVANWAREMGLGVSKQELNDALSLLLSNEIFRDRETGALKVDAYRNWVARSLESTVASFERMVEDELLREKVIQMLVGELGVTDAELERAHKLENDKVTVDYVAIDARSAAPLVPVTDAEVAEWLGKNEDKVKAEYDKLKPTKYTTPKTWDLRGIKIEAPDPADTDDPEQKKGFEDERAAAKARAEKVLAEVQTALTEKAVPEVPEGETPPVFDPVAAFAAIAQRESDDGSKEQGGKLVPATMRTLGSAPYGPAVAAAAEAWKVHEAAGVLEVASGFWILMPEAIAEEKVEEYDAVKSEIAKGLLQNEKVEPFLKTLADEVLAEAKKDPTKKLDDVVTAINMKYGAVERGLSASQTSFSRLSRLGPGYPASSPYLMQLGGRAPDLVAAAFSATSEAPLLDKVFSLADGKKLVIASFVELAPAEAITDEDKDGLRSQLTFERRRTVYRGWYEDLLAKKRAAGEVEFTAAFDEERKAAELAYVERGGEVPGMAVTPQPATP